MLFFEKKANLHETILARKLFEPLGQKLKKINSLRSPLCDVCSGPHCQSGASQTNKRVTYSQKNCHFFGLSIIRPIIKRPPFKEAFLCLKLEFYGADTDLLFFEKKANLHETILARKLFELLGQKLKKINSLRSPLCNVCSGPHCQSGASQTNKRVTYSQKNCHFFGLSIIRPMIKRPPFKEAFFVLKCRALIFAVDF